MTMILRRTREVIKTSNISFIVIRTTYQKYSRAPPAFQQNVEFVDPLHAKFQILHRYTGIMPDMNYLEVLVADATYHGSDALTYSSPQRLAAGALVAVQLRSKQVLGIVVREASRPRFPVKQIVSAPNVPPLPPQLLKLLLWMKDY